MRKVLIVGSGLFGLTFAQKLIRAEKEVEVTILEKRNHVGGNAYSYRDPETGIEIHKYGSHIFHTNNEQVVDFLSEFTEFVNYEHKVWTISRGQLLQMPVGLATLSQILGKSITPRQMREFISDETMSLGDSLDLKSLEGKAMSLIGRTLYERVIEGYTRKQWQTHPADLPAEIITRLPVRENLDPRYFNDSYQLMPKYGYGTLLENMADHPRIEIKLNTDFFEFGNRGFDLTVYTGPIDEFFGYKHGRLNWRTLDFHVERQNTSNFQGAPVINYADFDVPYTRIHEFKHYPNHGSNEKKSVTMKEYSRWSNRDDEPYYPVGLEEDRSRLKQYRKEQDLTSGIVFGGRLGSYQYLDMHMAVASAATRASAIIAPSQ